MMIVLTKLQAAGYPVSGDLHSCKFLLFRALHDLKSKK